MSCALQHLTMVACDVILPMHSAWNATENCLALQEDCSDPHDFLKEVQPRIQSSEKASAGEQGSLAMPLRLHLQDIFDMVSTFHMGVAAI